MAIPCSPPAPSRRTVQPDIVLHGCSLRATQLRARKLPDLVGLARTAARNYTMFAKMSPRITSSENVTEIGGGRRLLPSSVSLRLGWPYRAVEVQMGD